MLNALFAGLIDTFEPLRLAVIALGSIVGIFIGALPGFGPVAGLTLALPFLYGKDPQLVLPFAVALGSASYAGASVSSIMLNIPGDAPAAATCIDGYPLTRRGQGGRAIGAALSASTTGGIAGVLMAIIVIPVVVRIVLTLHMSEIFFLVLLGISSLAIVAQGGKLKGLVSGVLGLLLAFVGFPRMGSIPRFTFGSEYLLANMPLIPVILGLFAGTELVKLAGSGEAISRPDAVTAPRRQMLQGAREVFENFWLWLRSVIIGYIVGALPGIGATGATFIAYGQAKQTSKEPEKFGTGCIEGVIAPESANNASYGGALLTTLSFGIPGSAGMALILALFILVGIVPGPRMLIDYPELCFMMFWTASIAAIMSSIFCFIVVPYLMKITTLNPKYLLAALTPLVFLGAFAVDESMGSLVVVLVFTAFGVLMDEFDFSRSALVLGFILGALFEKYFWLALRLDGPLFFLRPVSLAIMALIVVSLNFNLIKSAARRLFAKKAGG